MVTHSQVAWFSTFVSTYSTINGVNIILLIFRLLKVRLTQRWAAD